MSEIIDYRVESLPAIHDLQVFRVAVISIHFATVNALRGINCLREGPWWAGIALGVCEVLGEGT
jgi:hypothetical protein